MLQIVFSKLKDLVVKFNNDRSWCAPLHTSLFLAIFNTGLRIC